MIPTQLEKPYLKPNNQFKESHKLYNYANLKRNTKCEKAYMLLPNTNTNITQK